MIVGAARNKGAVGSKDTWIVVNFAEKPPRAVEGHNSYENAINAKNILQDHDDRNGYSSTFRVVERSEVSMEEI